LLATQANIQGMGVDLAEFFTDSARDVAAVARERGLLILFDYRGPFVDIDVSENELRLSLRRLESAALELLDDGFLVLNAQTDWSDSGVADVAVSVAGTGGRADDSRISAMLHKLGLTERAQGDELAEGARVAEGVCPHTGHRVAFAANQRDGLLFAIDIVAPAVLIDRGSPPHAQGAHAWLVSAVHGAQQSLARRLQRLGWSTSVFGSPQQALEQLQRQPKALKRPSLVIAQQSPLVTLEAVQALREALPPYSQIVVAVSGTAPPANVDAIDYRAWPFSPHELEDMTRRMLEAVNAFAIDTVPSAFDPERRPKVLIVDDNEVNLMVAAGLMQVAGFEVRTALSGEQAIASCHEEAPDLVLMDVHMPVMDGLQATRYIRAFQQTGALPPFHIIAATADAVEIGQPACVEAGMDGYLSKPLTMQAIQREVRRVMPAARFAMTLP